MMRVVEGNQKEKCGKAVYRKVSGFSACAGEICRTKLAPYGCHRGNAEYGVILDCSGQWLQLSSMRLRIGLGIGGFRLLAHRPMTSGR